MVLAMVCLHVALNGTLRSIILVVGRSVVRTLCSFGSCSTSTWVTSLPFLPSLASKPADGFKTGMLSPQIFLGGWLGDLTAGPFCLNSHWSMNKSVTLSNSKVRPQMKWFSVGASLLIPLITKWFVVADCKQRNIIFIYITMTKKNLT